MELAVKWLSLLHEPDAIIEIRSIDPKPTVSGYFRADSPRIAAELAKYPNRTFYQSLNPVKSGCYARAQHERLVERPKETTSDNDIIGFQWILIDADPVRPSGVSASAEEKEAAHAVAGKTMKRLMATGFSEPIVADSGNGYHLLFKVHISTDDRQVVADFLSVLDMWFSTDEAKIDTAVYNPSRITKLYGTIAAKGAHTPERPHRQSCIIRYPEQIRETPIALVKNIAAELHQAAIPTEARRSGKESTWDIEHFLSAHGVEVEKKVAISSGTKYQLAHCPFDDSHQHGDAAVFAYHQGGFGFHCFHNSCAGYHWHEFRQKVDPAAYSSSPYAVTPAVPTAKVSTAENSPLLGKARHGCWTLQRFRM